jgi:2-dehydro-3-deoxyphosphooctonate aldolase (KDO 8-P synthase)
LPILTDIHHPEQAAAAAGVCDFLQIPAFLCRQTDLITAAARTGAAVNIKKGQFMAPGDMEHAVAKAVACDNRNVFLTERGTAFGYNDLVVDFRGLSVMRRFCPVVFDATHALQRPGGAGGASGGTREHVPLLVRAAAAAGVDGLFLEVHPDPERGLSDAATMLPLAGLEQLLAAALAVRAAAERGS